MKRFVGALTGALVLVGALSVATAPPGAAAGSRAVVILGGGPPTVVDFSGTISGIQALQLAGANVVTLSSGGGAAVCAINGVGNGASSMNVCLGSENGGAYWSYWLAQDGANGFSYSGVGGGVPVVGDGDVVGWRYGAGQPPPFSSFCSVAGCAPPPTAPPPPLPPPPPAPGNGSVGAVAPSGVPVPVTAAPLPNPSGVDATTEPIVTTQPEPVVSTTGPHADGRRGQALGVQIPGDEDDDGSGSPWGFIVALGLAVAVAAGAVVLRRRRSAA